MATVRQAAELDSLVREAERRAERIIAVVRLVVGVALGVSFSAVVSGRPAEDLFLSRHVFIAAGTIFGYFAIGIAAFILSAPRTHRRLFGFVFVTADAVFLHVGLFLAVTNTGVTPNYATAFPTIWTLPILLSIGAMRYSPALQAYAMAVLVGGFFYILVPYGSWDDMLGSPPPPALNPFFAQQPNVIRFTMLVVAAVVLVVAVWRTRRLLHEALEESRRRQSLTRFLPQEVAAIVERQTATDLRRGRNQTVAVLFVDIRDFTARSETMAPAVVGTFLTRFRAELSTAVASSGGIIDKFVGDAALVVFGVPEPRRGDAAAAVAAGRAILAAMARWSDELAGEGLPPVAVGIGIHLGEAFVGAVGNEARLEFTVLGDTVNVAARVEEASKHVGAALLVTEPVFAAAGLSTPDWHRLPAMTIRGRRATVALYAFGAPAALPSAASTDAAF